MSHLPLPSFGRPPVVEVVLGVQFELIPGFTNGHLGAFWSYLGGKGEWPRVTDAAQLPQEFERFGADLKWSRMDEIKVGLSQTPTARIQLANRPEDRMLQVQNGRLLYNWTGGGNGQYPRYNIIRPEFDRLLKQFKDFLHDQNLPPIQVNQWEVSYFNHLFQGTVWNEPSDWGKIFNFPAIPPQAVDSCRLESVGGQWVYEIEPQLGRLRIKIQTGWSAPNEKQILVCNLSARGSVREPEDQADVSAGLDLGHKIIVTGFRDLTSKEAREYWQEKE